MIELLILGKLWGIRRDTATLSGRDEPDYEGDMNFLGFLLAWLLWPLVLAWILSLFGVPKWLVVLLAVVGGVVAALLLGIIYFVVGMFVAVIGLVILVIMYA
jgi:hypothetical protein